MGKREKKIGERSEPRGGGKVALPFPLPQVTPRLASFADIFPIWPRFLPFSPTAEPGPGLMTVTLWNLRNYLWMTKSQLHVSNTSSLITNNKKELWKTVRSTSFPKPQLKSVSIFFKFINPCFLSYLLYHICLLLCLSGYFTVSLDLVPWVPEVFSRVRREASSAAGRRHERDRNRKPRMESLWHIEYRFTDRAGGEM